MRAQSCIHQPYSLQSASLQHRCRSCVRLPRRSKVRANAEKGQHSSVLTRWAYDAGLKTSNITLEDFTGDRYRTCSIWH